MAAPPRFAQAAQNEVVSPPPHQIQNRSRRRAIGAQAARRASHGVLGGVTTTVH